MSQNCKEHRDRWVVLSFVSVLLVLIYGPLAPWFVAADRFIYDIFAPSVRTSSLEDGVIVSISPARKSADEILAEYGRLLENLQNQSVKRIILAEPPAIEPTAELPGWAAILTGNTPIFVPTDHRLSDVASRTGTLKLQPDSDGVLRQSQLWHLQGGVMSPSLPLAVALASDKYFVDARISAADLAIFLTNYASRISKPTISSKTNSKKPW